MFGLDDDQLVANLEAMRRRVCCYAGPRCDCKFGASGRGEETGCPELSQAILLIKGQRDDVILAHRLFEESAANKLAEVKRILEVD